MLNQRRRHYLLGILAFATWFSGCNESSRDLNFKTGIKKQSSPLTVNVFKLKRETTVTKTSVYFGKLSPKRQSRLGFRQSGTVKAVLKQVGDTANQGDKLAELDQAQLENRQKQLQQAITRLEQEQQNSARREPDNLNTYRSQLNRVELELASGVIEAPYDCIISQIDVGIGDLVSPQKPALEIVENAAAMVEVQIPFAIADNLNVGQSVWITAGENILKAAIKTKSPQVTAVGNKRLTLEITDDSGKDTKSMFGQTVKIEFQTETATQGFWIPQSALVGKSDGLWGILVVANAESGTAANAIAPNKVVAQRLIKILSMKDDWVLVDATLPDTESIIVDGTHRIVLGQQVNPNDITSSLSIANGGNAQ